MSEPRLFLRYHHSTELWYGFYDTAWMLYVESLQELIALSLSCPVGSLDASCLFEAAVKYICIIKFPLSGTTTLPTLLRLSGRHTCGVPDLLLHISRELLNQLIIDELSSILGTCVAALLLMGRLPRHTLKIRSYRPPIGRTNFQVSATLSLCVFTRTLEEGIYYG